MQQLPKYLKVLMSVTFLLFCAVYASESYGLTDFGIIESLATIGGTNMMLGSCISVGNIKDNGDCADNSGGLYELYVISKNDIATWPALKAGSKVILEGNIALKPGKAWAKWDFAEETGEITHKSEGDAGSQAVTQELGVYIPSWTETIADIVAKALNGKFVTAVVGPDEKIQIGGSLRRPMKFDYDYKSGKKSMDKNGGDYKFSCGINHPPLYYSGTLPVLEDAVVPAT